MPRRVPRGSVPQRHREALAVRGQHLVHDGARAEDAEEARRGVQHVLLRPLAGVLVALLDVPPDELAAVLVRARLCVDSSTGVDAELHRLNEPSLSSLCAHFL